MRDVNRRKKLLFLSFNARNWDVSEKGWYDCVIGNAMNRIETVNGGGAAVKMVGGAVGA